MPSLAFAAPTDVRAFLVDALSADLVGPFDPSTGEELLGMPPSRFYLTGFLVPKGARLTETQDDDDELAGVGDDTDAGDAEPGPEPLPKQRQFLPSSCGMSFLLPQGKPEDALDVTLFWAEYAHGEPYTVEGSKSKKRGQEPVEKKGYRRKPPIEVALRVSLRDLDAAGRKGAGIPVPGHEGVVIVGRVSDAHVAERAVRAVSLFVENAREVSAEDAPLREEKTLFQVELRVGFEGGILARETRGALEDRDAMIADVQFRDVCEYAVGHGASVRVVDRGPEERGLPGARAGATVRTIGTCYLPRCEVRAVRARIPREGEPLANLETRMDALAALKTRGDIEAALSELPRAYEAWITEMEGRGQHLGDEARRETAHMLAARAREARRRIEEGITLLANDETARKVFAWANRAMAEAARRTRANEEPRWRLFQLGFLLLALPSTLDGAHPEREVVELIYFPTGGGKTEAYLGLIACALLARRLRGKGTAHEGLGVAVLLRYTLRLLTLDQLERAARLVCALEVVRREVPAELGKTRFSIGLWVGQSATANTFADARERIDQWKDSENERSPLPISACPWCKTAIERNDVVVDPSDEAVAVKIDCGNFRECPFANGKHGDSLGIPVLFVDEHVYRELPCFVLSTVDKLAMLPWRAEAGLLFGRATHKLAHGFLGPAATKTPKDAKALPEGLLPPELVVQDELHLISGPLGTIVGLYETAVSALMSRVAKPKVLASTATVKRAEEQVRAIFGRDRTDVYPPPGIDDGETFFAEVARDAPGRLYVGVAAQGRAQKQLLIRVYVALLAASKLAHEATREAGQEPNVADGYTTLVGYFNSLRELGGMRRLCDDDVQTRLESRAGEGKNRRAPVDYPAGAPHPWARPRSLRETLELTSREKTSEIASHKVRLDLPFTDERSCDVLLASNMISVGVDIPRLGLMAIAGQPKTVSEYIQASSRVGRGKFPGLVVTCLNVAKARDRSHYERFEVVHRSFYRYVEAQSLTPFSDPALRRALAGAVVALARHVDVALTPGSAAGKIAEHTAIAEKVAEAFAERAKNHADAGDEDAAQRRYHSVRESVLNLMEAWRKCAEDAKADAAKLRYSKLEKKSGDRDLLYVRTEVGEGGPQGPAGKFSAGMSMRDVEASTDVWIDRSVR